MTDVAEQPLRFAGAASVPEGEGKKLRYERGGRTRELLLVRLQGRLAALDTLCPHEGGRLAEGPLVKGKYVSCPLHLYRFDPRSGECVGIECDPATTLRVQEDGEDALVWVVDADGIANAEAQ